MSATKTSSGDIEKKSGAGPYKLFCLLLIAGKQSQYQQYAELVQQHRGRRKDHDSTQQDSVRYPPSTPYPENTNKQNKKGNGRYKINIRRLFKLYKRGYTWVCLATESPTRVARIVQWLRYHPGVIKCHCLVTYACHCLVTYACAWPQNLMFKVKFSQMPIGINSVLCSSTILHAMWRRTLYNTLQHSC